MVVVFALGALMEYLSITAAYGLEPFRLLAYLHTASLFVIYYGVERYGTLALLACGLLLLFGPFLMMIAALGREDMKTAIPAAAMSELAAALHRAALLMLAMLRESRRGWVYVLFLFCRVGGRHGRHVRGQEHGTAQTGAAHQSR